MRETVLGLLLVSLWSIQVLAAAQPSGPEFQTNTYTRQGQFDPAVAANSAGDFTVVWTSRGQDGDDLGIFTMRFGSAGGGIGSEFQVNMQTESYQKEPAIAFHSSGTSLIVWTTNTDSSGADVHGQRYTSAGGLVGSEFQINGFTINDQSQPAIAALPQGFVVVWFNPANATDIVARLFDSAGDFVGEEFQVNSFTTDVQQLPTVAANGVGDFVVAWQSYLQDGDGYGIFGQRFASNGSRLGTEFQVSTYTVSYQKYPAAAAFDSNAFVVTWFSYLQDGSSNGIFGQRYGSNGSPLGSEFQVNAATVGDQDFPAVTGDLGGGFTATWTSEQDGSGFGISGQCFDSLGNRLGGEFLVNSYTPDDQTTPAMASTGNGTFVVSWQSYEQDGSGEEDGVFSRRFAGASPPPPPPPAGSPSAVPVLDPRALAILFAALLLAGWLTLRVRRPH